MRLRPETLDKYVTMARDKLIEVAGSRETITYNELMDEMGGPGRGYIGQVLKEVCQGEYRHGRPLLGALVVRAKVKHPGAGFWRSALAPESISNGTKQQRIAFWENERKKVYKYWQKHNL